MRRFLIPGFTLLAVLLSSCISSGDSSSGAGGADATATSTRAPAATATSTKAPAASPTPSSTPTEEVASQPTATATASPTPTVPAPVATAANPLDEISIRLELAVDGFSQPTGVVPAFDGTGRLFVLEQEGTVRIVQDGRLLDEPFLDLTDRVGIDEKSGYFSEQGLLGLVFHPNYRTNGFFFVDYTNSDGDVVISRFEVSDDPNLADEDSELEVLLLRQPDQTHNGGQLAFGPDGYLWIGVGDGGGAGDTYRNAQNGRTLLGTILRIDPLVDPLEEAGYDIPPDNPFVDDPRVRDEIWAYGLRNPWRFSFDRETGDLYISDVGQNLWEEINFQPAGSQGGENYGWPIMEGNHCYEEVRCDTKGLVRPAVDYHHKPGVCSVIGGYVYRGELFPSLDGTYFFTDACDGVIRAMQFVGDRFQAREVLEQDGVPFSSFGEDENGELYLVGMQPGALYRIVSR